MRKTGFTLIELVMVIVIIGILAAVAIPRFMDLRDEAKRARCEADVGAIRTGITGWYAKYHANNSQCPGTSCTANGFPTNITGSGFAGEAFTDGVLPPTTHIANLSVTSWDTPYNNTIGTYNMTQCCNSSAG